LNRDASVDVEVVGATGSKFRNDLSRRPRHLFHSASPHRGQIDGAAAQNYYALVTIGPRGEGLNCLEGLSTYHQRIDACQTELEPARVRQRSLANIGSR
jgi:hypothetical protein